MDTKYITPVEKIGDYWFKREDLYIPYNFSPANGSKLRQCQLLIEKNFDIALRGIVTGTSILSPQAVIAASVAKEHNIPCNIFYGGTKEELLEKKKYPVLAKGMGANISIVSKMGYTSVLNARAEEYAQEHGMFNIKYGFDLKNNLDVFIGSVAGQVRNIPQEVENVVVTVGSAITIIGILYGLALYRNKVKKVYAIGCAPNRMKKIQEYADLLYFETTYALPIDKICYIDAFNTKSGYKYENTMQEEYCGLKFHPRYEAKTFHWLKEQKIPNTLMWVTGADM